MMIFHKNNTCAPSSIVHISAVSIHAIAQPMRSGPPAYTRSTAAQPSNRRAHRRCLGHPMQPTIDDRDQEKTTDRKSTRLNSSHVAISYAVFCLKKKKKKKQQKTKKKKTE